MRLRNIILLALYVIVAVPVSAQFKSSYRDLGEQLTPSAVRYSEFDFYTEERLLTKFFANPAYNHKLTTDSIEQRSYIAANGNYANLSNDYHIAEGNNFKSYSLDAFGVMSLKAYGTLSGQVEFAQGEDKNI